VTYFSRDVRLAVKVAVLQSLIQIATHFSHHEFSLDTLLHYSAFNQRSNSDGVVVGSNSDGDVNSNEPKLESVELLNLLKLVEVLASSNMDQLLQSRQLLPTLQMLLFYSNVEVSSSSAEAITKILIHQQSTGRTSGSITTNQHQQMSAFIYTVATLLRMAITTRSVSILNPGKSKQSHMHSLAKHLKSLCDCILVVAAQFRTEHYTSILTLIVALLGDLNQSNGKKVDFIYVPLLTPVLILQNCLCFYAKFLLFGVV
jgi:hypothetical protein